MQAFSVTKQGNLVTYSECWYELCIAAFTAKCSSWMQNKMAEDRVNLKTEAQKEPRKKDKEYLISKRSSERTKDGNMRLCPRKCHARESFNLSSLEKHVKHTAKSHS